ncbi:hypothetical protein ZWY2020_055579 [Hordeum vulgare]|nr:hypothetical protein ZWY2020_055579 [Hordeum vulgare]
MPTRTSPAVERWSSLPDDLLSIVYQYVRRLPLADIIGIRYCMLDPAFDKVHRARFIEIEVSSELNICIFDGSDALVGAPRTEDSKNKLRDTVKKFVKHCRKLVGVLARLKLMLLLARWVHDVVVDFFEKKHRCYVKNCTVSTPYREGVKPYCKASAILDYRSSHATTSHPIPEDLL